jgi:hypothetical protein
LHVKGKRRQTARKWKERNCYGETEPSIPHVSGCWASQHRGCGAGATSAKRSPKGVKENYPERRIKRAPAPGSWCMRLLLLFSFYRFSHSAPSPRGTFQIYKNRNCTDFRSRTQVKYIWFWRGEYVYTYRSSQKRGNPILKLWVDVWVVVVGGY